MRFTPMVVAIHSREMVIIPRDELECRKVKENAGGCMPGIYHCTYHLGTLHRLVGGRLLRAPVGGRWLLAQKHNESAGQACGICVICLLGIPQP